MPRGNLSKFHSGVLESPPKGNAHSEPKGLFVEYLGQISAFLPASFFFTQKRAKSSFVPRVHLFEPLFMQGPEISTPCRRWPPTHPERELLTPPHGSATLLWLHTQSRTRPQARLRRIHMARIIGNLDANDDFTHPLGEESNFNESMYFNFFDPKKSTGGFVRLGNRANEGRAEMTLCLFLPDGRVLFNFKRAQIDNNDAFDAGGMLFEVIEPSEILRTVYEGQAIELTNARELADPTSAFRESPRKKISLDLEHVACGPMYGSSHSKAEEKRDAAQQFGKAHYEQHMSIRGRIEIDEEVIEIEGLGLRDHSWGPRHWQAIHGYEWLTINLGPDFSAMVSVIRRDPESQKSAGVVIRNGEFQLIKDVTIETEYEENGLYHKNLKVDIELEDGSDLQIHGEVENFIPLRNRRDHLQTHIGEGMTRWTCEDRVGYGLSEYLKQVDADPSSPDQT